MTLRLNHAHYRIWKHLKTLCSCKCLSPPPYLKFTLSPMYKIKLKGKREKETHNFHLFNSVSNYRTDNGIIELTSVDNRTSSHTSSSLQAIIEPLSGRYFTIGLLLQRVFHQFPPSLDLRDGICRNKQPPYLLFATNSSFVHQKT